MACSRRNFVGMSAVGLVSAHVGAHSAPSPTPLEREEKLSKTARIEAPGVPVSDLLSAISGKCGVVLTGRGIVADEKVIVFGPRRPLRDWLADLATLLNATWRAERRPTGSTRLILELGAAAQRHEQKLTAAQLEALAAPIHRHLQALRESPEQLARRPKSDLTRTLLSDPQSRMASELFSRLSPTQLEQLLSRRRLNVSFGALHPEQQDGLRRIWGLVMEAEAAFAASPEGMAQAARLTLRRKPEDVERGFLRLRVQRIGGSALIGMFAGGFPAVSEAFTEEDGRENFATSGWPIFVVKGKDLWLLPAHGNPYATQPVDGDVQLPSASRGITERTGWVTRLQELARTTGRPVMSDFYRMPPVNAPADPPDRPDSRPGVAFLDELCRPSGYLWWAQGATLCFRKRDWFQQRTFEVPDRWMAAVAGEVSAGLRVPTAVLRRVAQLTPEQAAGLYSFSKGKVTEEPEDLYPARALLRVMETGDPAGKRLLRSITAIAPGVAPPLAPDLAAGRLNAQQLRLVPDFLAETDGMLGMQLPAGFRAWVYTVPPARSAGPDALPVVDLEVRWTFEPAGRVQAMRIPLPCSPWKAPLQLETEV